ncbi:MAG: hypothetical protein ACRC3Y_09585 [Romboutsia sp.]|uniref:hypothetical protein n=1 Tax=Romboutsia sp. TaxID=1965302 RepID=UPI003F3D7611
MEIIKNEIKKIFNLTNLIVVGIITLIIWNLFISFEIEYFPNGSLVHMYNNSVYMLENYGEIVDEEEFEDFKKMREEKVRQADEYLSNRKEFVNVGLDTYEKFRKVANRGFGDDEKGKLASNLIFKEDEALFWEIPEIDDRIENYEVYRKAYIGSESYESHPEKTRKRIDEVYESEDLNSPFSYDIYENYNSLIKGINLLIIITVATLISPIFIKDNKNKINYIQYSSKEGRKLFNKKILWGIISSIIIVTIQLSIFFIMYKSNNTYMFWNCSMNSIFNGGTTSWFDLTFGQYIIITVLLTYIVGIVVAIMAMGVSSKVKTYISLIGIQIPILFILWTVVKYIGINYVTSIYNPKYTTHFTYITLILISVFILTSIVKKEKKLDI